MVLTRGEGVKRIFDFSLRQDDRPVFCLDLLFPRQAEALIYPQHDSEISLRPPS